MLRFIKTTVLGGIIFIVPIVIFVAIIGKALSLINKFAMPLANLFAVDAIGGIAVVHLLSLAILVLICFIAGLAAKTASARNVVRSLEVNVLEKIPAYELLKTKTQSVLTPEEMKSIRPAMVRFDDSWQIVFKVERLADGKVVIFLPGSPDPWSGAICVVTEDRVTPLDITIQAAVKMMKRLGRGATDTLQHVPAPNGSKPFGTNG